MPQERWSEADLPPDERAELREDIRLTREAEARGEYEDVAPESIGVWFEGVKERGRAMLAAESKKAR